MRLTLLEPPAVEPLTAEEAKERLRIGNEVPDAVMDAFIAAARQQIDGAEGWLGRALITQRWRGELDGFPPAISVPLPPLQDVSSLQYVGFDGSINELDPGAYTIVQGRRPLIVPAFGKNWPEVRCVPGAVAIEFIAGYGDEGSDVPEAIRAAIALAVGQLRSLTAENLFLSEETVEGVGTRRYVVGGNAAAAIECAISAMLANFRIFG